MSALPNTRGGLVPARIVELDDTQIDLKTNKIKLEKEGDNTRIKGEGSINILCMFNPSEYTVTKSNNFEEIDSANSGNSPRANFKKAGPQTLQLNLIFDTYEQKEKDLVKVAKDLWQLMATKPLPGGRPQDRIPPPLVAFIWGSFYFVAYITQMSQKFTLFTHKGVPVRAEVNITFTQYVELDDYPNQNPTSGGGPIDRIWTVTAGDRIDTISASVYGSANQWRHIADYNRIDNPDALQPGQQLLIPYLTAVQSHQK
jgi:hypothetical protein